MSDKKQQSFGGVRFFTDDVSPPVSVGRGEKRSEAKMYNIKLDFDQLLRLEHSINKATNYLSDFKETSDSFKQGARLVLNFETGHITIQSHDLRGEPEVELS